MTKKALTINEVARMGGKAHSRAHMSMLGKLSAKKRKLAKKKLSTARAVDRRQAV